MTDGAAGTPSTGAAAVPPLDLAALRARLLDTEARLSQTQQDLSAAQQTITSRDAAAAAQDAVGSPGGAPVGVGARGGQAAGRIAADGVGGGAVATPVGSVPPAADGHGRPAAVRFGAGRASDDAPLGGDALDDYVDPTEGDFHSAAADDWSPAAGGAGGAGRHGGRRPGRPSIDDAGAYNDGFDFPVTFSPSDWLQSFDIPRSVLRADGMPMPFTPCDPVHSATFTTGSRDELEARHWYCTLAWTQSVFNAVLAAHHASGNAVELLEELVAYLVGAVRRVYALGVSRYDYLALRQSEPNLADAFAHADAVPRNSLRGDGARRFISRVVRAEAHASAKVGAAERGYSFPQHAARAAAPAPAPRARSPARGGGGSRGGLGGRGGRGGRGGGGRGRGGGRA